MQQYNPQMLILGRFLLKEKLSSDAISGKQVWTADDTKTGQLLIGHISADGRIDWFSDSPATRKTSFSYLPAQDKMQRPAPNSSRPQFQTLLTKGRLTAAAFFSLLASASIFTYVNRHQFFQKAANSSSDTSLYSTPTDVKTAEKDKDSTGTHPVRQDLSKPVVTPVVAPPPVAATKKQVQPKPAVPKKTNDETNYFPKDPELHGREN
jgi:hypothetical protein